MREILMVTVLALAIAGCGDKREAEVIVEEPAEADGVFDPMLETMDRAKEVEDIAADRKNAMDEQLKEIEGD